MLRLKFPRFASNPISFRMRVSRNSSTNWCYPRQVVLKDWPNFGWRATLWANITRDTCISAAKKLASSDKSTLMTSKLFQSSTNPWLTVQFGSLLCLWVSKLTPWMYFSVKRTSVAWSWMSDFARAGKSLAAPDPTAMRLWSMRTKTRFLALLNSPPRRKPTFLDNLFAFTKQELKRRYLCPPKDADELSNDAPKKVAEK